MRSLAIVLAIAVSASISASARAGVIAFDSFETYTVGNQLESGPSGVDGTGVDGGSGFSGPYNTDNALKTQVTVQAIALSRAVGAFTADGGANVVRYVPGADSNNLIMRPLPAQSSTFYFSFLLRTANPVTDEDFLQIGFSDVATGEPKVSVGAAGTSAGTPPPYFMVRAGTGASNQVLNNTAPLDPDTTYLMVGKVSKTSGSGTFNRVDLIVNPTDFIEPTTWTASKQAAVNGGGPASVSNFTVRTFRLDAADDYLLDRVTVADTYIEAIQAPEPSGLLLATGIVGLLAQRRRRAV